MKMIESVDTVSSFIQGTGPAGTSAATLATLLPLSLRAADNKPLVELLPNELLANIFEFLDSPKPSSSESVLHDEPHFNLTKSNNAPLKAASCVSKRWRRGTIPLLFKHAQLVVEENKTPWLTLDEMIQPFFDFVGEHQLRRIIQSFTFIVHAERLANIVHKQGKISKDFLSFWGRLFQVIDPQELLVVAPVMALGYLTTCRVYQPDAWNFDCPCHYLRLQIPPKASTRIAKAPKEEQMLPKPASEDAQVSGPAAPLSPPFKEEPEELPRVSLWEIRPWTSLLLNEGSFIRAYATYEFWQRQPPSILPDLVGADTDDPARISPTICDFSYVGLFPMASHFSSFTTNLPKLNRLYVQLVPRNEILQDPTKMAQVEAEDLWMERNSCYALLMRELFNTPPAGNYKYLEEFESGDAADRDAWEMAVEYVKRAANGWKVASEGVFVRDTKEKATVPAAVGDEGEPSALLVNSAT